MTQLRDETLADLLKALWQSKIHLLCGGICGLVIGTALVMMAVPQYRAVMVMSPNTAQITLPAQNTPAALSSQTPDETLLFLRYLNILRGPQVARAMEQTDPQIFDILTPARLFFFSAAQKMRNSAMLSAYFIKNVQIRPIGETALRVISFTHNNPQNAQEILTRLHQNADQILRAEHEKRSDARLAYVQSMLAKVTNPAHRQALSALLLEEERQGMMIRMDKYFAAITVEPPYIEPRPVWPRKGLILAICTLLGLLTGWVVFGLRHAP